MDRLVCVNTKRRFLRVQDVSGSGVKRALGELLMTSL